ncbi:hypothetical protein V0R48_14440 [Pseudomonas alcaligenes]|uniref:hypothetical protein n=1 Tax=Aquipseudomonas alcaligenes TaxID=43263 RepID=UPI002E7BBA36|nr:hypothetical protein [Pseudomonas alcaligenes]MEE1950184.1 hypothetical protein [Pseudomonas alcaligenes]
MIFTANITMRQAMGTGGYLCLGNMRVSGTWLLSKTHRLCIKIGISFGLHIARFSPSTAMPPSPFSNLGSSSPRATEMKIT